uniref:Uncharacterized protein n=1 Tax=Anguilla anguilla TaxID=7936 RepID=A0A0E9RWP8_ANGAN
MTRAGIKDCLEVIFSLSLCIKSLPRFKSPIRLD